MSDVEEEKEEEKNEPKKHSWNINLHIETTGEHVEELMDRIEDVVCPNAEAEGKDHKCEWDWGLGARVTDTFEAYVREAQIDCQWVRDEMKERNIDNPEIAQLVDDAIEAMDAVWKLTKAVDECRLTG